jgi:hypothetical protein
MRDLLEHQICVDAELSNDTTVLAELLLLLTDEQVYNALSDDNQWQVDHHKKAEEYALRKKHDVMTINNIIINIGTVVQEEGFEQVPVHHMTNRDFGIDGNVVLYIGGEKVFCEGGKKYRYDELNNDTVKKVLNILK